MSVLRLENVTRSFGDFRAVDGFSMTVAHGELRCLLGPNGAGKSTCMDLITGRLKVSSGRIMYYDTEITDMPEHRIARLGVGRKFQVPAVFRTLTVRQNLEVAFGRQKGPFSTMVSWLATGGSRARFEETVELVGLKDRLDVEAGLLSHGEMQWLEIGMVLMNDPKLLLMDEPTAGMTEQETHKTSEIFTALKGRHSLVVVEHDMSFVREIADIVTVMHMGSLLAEGPIAEIETDPRVREVYLGTPEDEEAHA